MTFNHPPLRPLLLLSLLVLFSGCTSPADSKVESVQESEDRDSTHEAASQLELTFVSGHFGTYWDCPEEAYTSGDGEIDGIESEEGECSQDVECPAFVYCEGAQVTLRLANTGSDLASGVHVSAIVLLDGNGQGLVSLPIVAQNNIENQDNDVLQPGESITLRVDFRGPLDLSEFTGQSNDGRGQAGEAPVEIRVEQDEFAPAKLVTPGLASIPEIAT